MKNFSFLLLNLLSYISFYNADGRYLLIDVDSVAKIETGPTVMKAGAKPESQFSKCLKNLTEGLPEICQTKTSEEEKCQEWLKENKDTFQNMLDP